MNEVDPVAISCDDVARRLSDSVTIGPVTWQVDAGRLVALIGANGSGKTTLLRLICGLLEPTTGSVAVLGRSVSAGRPTAGVGGMIEEPAFLPWMSGRDNLAYICAGRSAWVTRIPEVLDLVALSARADHRVREYSQGMRQRLGIARALLGDPRVLVLDEPTNGLDPEGMSVIRDLLTGFARRGGTVVVSSHALGELARIADEVAVMGGGRLLASGPLNSVCRDNETLEDVYFRLGAAQRHA